MQRSEEDTNKPSRPAKTVDITIDQQAFALPKDEVTAEELRALPEPDVGPDRDLYLEGKGDRDDDLIEAGETVKLKKGLHFFTAPASITPGRAA
jgi:hypothetical protein